MGEPPPLRGPVDLPRLARAAVQRGDWATALGCWEKSISARPGAAAAAGWRAARADALVALGRFAEAEAAFKALVRDRPDLQAGFVGLAKLAHQRRHWRAAVEHWEACLRAFPAGPSSSGWRSSRGTALLELGRAAEAEEVFLALQREHPALPLGCAGLARVAQSRGDRRGAVEHWEACLERFPRHPGRISWLTSRAKTLAQLEAWEAAYHAWEELAEEADDDLQLQIERARSLFAWRGPTEDVERLIAAVLVSSPDNVSALRLHARVAASSGDSRTALARYSRCIELRPTEIENYQRAMDAACQLGDAATARQLLAMAPTEITNTTGFLCRVNLSYLTLRANIDAGLTLIVGLDEALLDRPSAAAIGRFLHYAIRYEQLLGFSRRMLARFPDSPIFIGHYLLALCHVRGREVFEQEKPRLLAPLGNQDAAQVLSGLPPSWLSVAEAKRVIDDRLAKPSGSVLKTHALLHIAWRGDPEILAYVGDRIGSDGDLTARFLARSVLSSIEDRRRIATANLGGCRWLEFQRAAAAIRRDVDAWLAAPAAGRMPRPLAEALAMVRRIGQTAKAAWMYSADSYADAVSFVTWLSDRVRAAEPTSVVRLNDGEGVFLPYPRIHREFQNADRRTFQQIWWGEERIVGPAGDRLAQEHAAAVSRADAIGIPTPRWLIAHLGVSTVRHTARGLTSVLTFMELLPPETLRQKIVMSSHMHTDVEQWDLYRQILPAGSSVSVVSCHDLEQTLAERFGVAVRRWHRIAPEHKYARMFDDADSPADEPFYPVAFERIMARVAPLPGEVFLVAAGFLGKLICDRVRERGGIGIDIGCVADLWMGHATRWVTGGDLSFDIASSLIEAQPIRDRFAALDISPAEPCRSDRTRRLNLTGRFARLFEDTRTAQAFYPLRLIGHPRCGARYVARVLNRLGLDLGHERPGGDGFCGWVHAVHDLNLPLATTPVPAPAFRTTLAYVRDPASAIPSIMLENCLGASFDFRRFHIARRLGIDIAQRRSALERAVASYLLWMRIVDEERPALTLRIERLLAELSEHAALFVEAGIRLDWTQRDAAASVPNDLNEAIDKVAVGKPEVTAEDYRRLPADLADPLVEFCERHGYPQPCVHSDGEPAAIP